MVIKKQNFILYQLFKIIEIYLTKNDYCPVVKQVMKGRTTCPECKHDFVLELPDENKKHEVVCPKCQNKFNIQVKCPNPKSDDECSWEEHGEPRKTILSSIKPKTNKPMVAAIILVCVFALGITTAVFSEVFIETSMDFASGVGLTGSVSIVVTDITNTTIEDVSILLGNLTVPRDEKGRFSIDNIELGIQTLKLSATDYKTHTREILIVPFFKSWNTITMAEGDGAEAKIEFDAWGCTFILVIFSVFALLGSIVCLRRNHIDVAYAGSLIGIFSIGFLFVGSILSIIAFIIIVMSREEFENGKKGKIF